MGYAAHLSFILTVPFLLEATFRGHHSGSSASISSYSQRPPLSHRPTPFPLLLNPQTSSEVFLFYSLQLSKLAALPLLSPNLSRSNQQGVGGSGKNGDEDEEEVLDEETLRRDQAVKGAIDVLIREYASELNAPSQDPDSQPRIKKRKEKKEEVVLA